jgi:hypothetical protein
MYLLPPKSELHEVHLTRVHILSIPPIPGTSLGQLKLDVLLIELHKQLRLAQEAVLVHVETVERVGEDFGLLLGGRGGGGGKRGGG